MQGTHETFYLKGMCFVLVWAHSHKIFSSGRFNAYLLHMKTFCADKHFYVWCVVCHTQGNSKLIYVMDIWSQFCAFITHWSGRILPITQISSDTERLHSHSHTVCVLSSWTHMLILITIYYCILNNQKMIVTSESLFNCHKNISNETFVY